MQLPLHAPAPQVRVAMLVPEQTSMQPPQLSALVAMLVSQPLAELLSQSAKPGIAAQETPHTPLLQAAVPLTTVHLCPQLPQLLTSVPVGVSQPLANCWSQSPKPALHVAILQTAPMQV